MQRILRILMEALFSWPSVRKVLAILIATAAEAIAVSSGGAR
jgi:hypothetical protein